MTDKTQIIIAGIMAYTVYRIFGKIIDSKIAISAIEHGATDLYLKSKGENDETVH